MNSTVLLFLLFFTSCLQADRVSELPVCRYESRQISTLYAAFDIPEDVIWDLLNSPGIERLKGVHQYGISYFLDPSSKQYSRFDHSVGVFMLLRLYGASLNEQIAGLLHDASHTVFSHTGDYLLSKDYNTSYQDGIHGWYLAQSGLEAILAKHEIALADVLPKSGQHQMLEQELPDLCADRIEYNIQEGLMNGMLSREEIPLLLASLHYEKGTWFFTDRFFAKKLARISMYGTEKRWGGPDAYVQNVHAAQALRYALEQKLLSMDDLHFSQDSIVWQTLNTSKDPELQTLISNLRSYKESFEYCEPDASQTIVRTKLRAIDPFVQCEGGRLKRLSHVDEEFKEEIEELKYRLQLGWAIKPKNQH